MGNISDDQNLLRQLQLAETDMLRDIAAVCDKYHVAYYLSSGTLLGAVRHQGFIPWDDDIDLEMPVNDYYRFLEIAQDALGGDYFVQTYMTDPNYNFAYTRIRKNNTTMLNPYHRAYQIHHGVWIDIFPLIPVRPGLSLEINKMILKISNFIQIQNKIDSHEAEFRKMLGPMGMAAMKAFSKIPMKTRQKIHKKMLDAVFNADPEKCSHRANVWGNITSICPKEVYEGTPDQIIFEGSQFKVPHDYIRYLEIKYGDYMTLPPEEKRTGHGKDMIIDLNHSYEEYTQKTDG